MEPNTWFFPRFIRYSFEFYFKMRILLFLNFLQCFTHIFGRNLECYKWWNNIINCIIPERKVVTKITFHYCVGSSAKEAINGSYWVSTCRCCTFNSYWKNCTLPYISHRTYTYCIKNFVNNHISKWKPRNQRNIDYQIRFQHKKQTYCTQWYGL